MNKRPKNANDAINRIDWPKELIRHDRWLRTVILARCGESQAVDDILQEVSVAAIAQKSPLSDASKVAPWLYQLAVRQSLMYRRKMGRQRKLQKSYAERSGPEFNQRQATDPLNWILAEERRALVRKALDKLNPRDEEMLLLKYTENWNYRQIAEHLGLTHNAVESRLHRARRKLRRQLVSWDVVGATRT